jgi:hypothetical protein
MRDSREKQMKRPIGPTGDFPRGRLNRQDEGGLRIALHIERGNVRLSFGKKIAWFAMPKATALMLAELIKQKAMELPDE